MGPAQIEVAGERVYPRAQVSPELAGEGCAWNRRAVSASNRLGVHGRVAE